MIDAAPELDDEALALLAAAHQAYQEQREADA